MKRKISNILVLMMAVTVFFVGAGVTIVDLCCTNCVENLVMMKKANSNCHDENAAAAQNHSCCQDEGEDNGMLPCTNKHEGKCCDAERISVDIDHRTFKPDLAGSDLVWSVLHCQCCCFCHTTDIGQKTAYAGYADAVPIPPREYLSLLRILII